MRWWGKLKKVLMRSVHTSHACNFQDRWKWKSARPTTSQKLVTPLKSSPAPFYAILLLHQQVWVLWGLGANCLLSWPHAINLRLLRVGVTDSWDFQMAVILYSGNSASYPNVSLSLPRWKCARKGRREGDKGRDVPFPWSPAVHHQSLAFLARHYHLLFIVIIPCTIYSLLFLLFYCCLQVIQIWSPLLEDYNLKGDKSWSHTVYTSPPKITVMPSSFSTYFQNAGTWSPF